MVISCREEQISDIKKKLVSVEISKKINGCFVFGFYVRCNYSMTQMFQTSGIGCCSSSTVLKAFENQSR